MAIILEGPDAAGKSTLARTLAGQFGMHHVVSGGAPHNEGEVRQYCEMQLACCQERSKVIDRVTPISHPIYNPVYVGNPMVMDYLKRMLDSPFTILVYCRPPTEALMRPEKHEWKDYDTEEHKQKILLGQMEFIRRYDEVFSRLPHLTYDYSDVEEVRVELITSLAATQNHDNILHQLRTLMRTNGQR